MSKNKKNITIFHPEIIILTVVKNRSILHRRVFVMYAWKVILLAGFYMNNIVMRTILKNYSLIV